MAHKLTTCTFCGVGCGIYLETAGNQVVGAYPSMSHPTNQGRICVRGLARARSGQLARPPENPADSPQRTPGSCRVGRGDRFHRRPTQRDPRPARPGCAGFLNSPRCSNEETYLLQKLARAVIGTNNVDHGTGVYCNNTINVLLDMLGVPATTNSIGELARSEVIVVDGVDLARQLPTIGGWVIRAKLAGAKLVVIDARRHRVAESADILPPAQARHARVLYGAMAKVIVDRGLMNLPFIKAHCRGYEAFLAARARLRSAGGGRRLRRAGGAHRSRGPGVCPGPAAAILYSTGIEARRSQHPVAGEPGPADRQHRQGGRRHFALTEHNNLQGVCDMGMLPDRLPGYRALPTTGAAGRSWRQLWNTKLPAQPGLVSARHLLDERGREQGQGPLALPLRPGQHRLLLRCAATPCSNASWSWSQHLFLTETAQYRPCGAAHWRLARSASPSPTPSGAFNWPSR